MDKWKGKCKKIKFLSRKLFKLYLILDPKLFTKRIFNPFINIWWSWIRSQYYLLSVLSHLPGLKLGVMKLLLDVPNALLVLTSAQIAIKIIYTQLDHVQSVLEGNSLLEEHRRLARFAISIAWIVMERRHSVQNVIVVKD